VTELHLAGEGRAARLLAQVDARWLDWAAGLPPRLRDLARRARTFQGTACGSEPFRGPSAMNPGITCTPWLFWEIAEPLGDGDVVSLAFAGSLVVLASVLLDHLVDGQADVPGDTALLHQALCEAGTARLRERLPGCHLFWRDLERLGAEHVAGLAAERQCQEHPEQLIFESFLSFVPAKFSPIVATMAAFVHAVGRPEWLPAIESSIKRLAVASQLLDDLGDWEEDLQQRHLTLFLARLAPAEAWAGPDWPVPDDIQRRIADQWADIECVEMVQEWLEASLEAARGLACARWQEYLNGYRALACQHLARSKARHTLRLIEPLVRSTPPTCS